MVRREHAGQRAGEPLNGIQVTDEQDLAGGSNLGAESVSGTKTCLRQGIDGDRHLVLAADPGPAAAPLDLYLIAHG